MGFHESLAHELLTEDLDGVKTTLVCPYIVDTGMFEGCKIRCVSQSAHSNNVESLYPSVIKKTVRLTSLEHSELQLQEQEHVTVLGAPWEFSQRSRPSSTWVHLSQTKVL